MNILEQCLRVSNSAVVLGTSKCFFHLTERMEQIQEQVFERMRPPLLTLMAGGSHELNFCVLHHILLMVGKKPRVFSRDYRQFYNRYNEPTHVKYVKIDILSAIADASNVADIITELSEYVTDVDQELARRSIRAIADIAVSTNFSTLPPGYSVSGQNGHPGDDGANATDQALSAMQDQIVDTMVDFLEMNLDHVRDESLVVMKDLLRKFPEKRHDVLVVLPRIINSVQQPNAKTAIIWMIGEFGQDMRRAPYVLEKLIDEFSEETFAAVLLELLSASIKLFFKRPPEMQSMLGRLLQAAINECVHQDVRDRALFYYRLIQKQPTEQTASIVAQFKNEQPITVFAEMAESDLKEKLFQEFNSLAVVYNKPSEMFISPSHLPAASVPLEDDDEDEEEEVPRLQTLQQQQNHHQQQHNQYQQTSNQQHAPPQPSVANAAVDLLDMDFGAPAVTPAVSTQLSLQLVSNPVMDAGTFQGKWTSSRVIGNVQVVLPHVPAQADVEKAFSRNYINTMASGDVGPQLKFFFYAQDVRGSVFLAETLIEKSERLLRATIKGDDEAYGPLFADHMQRVLMG
jgi:hypothetical protein